MLEDRGPVGGSRPQQCTQSSPGPTLRRNRPPPLHLRLLWFRPADWEGPRNAVPTMLWGVPPPPPSLPPPLPLVEEDGGRRSGGSGHPAV